MAVADELISLCSPRSVGSEAEANAYPGSGFSLFFRRRFGSIHVVSSSASSCFSCLEGDRQHLPMHSMEEELGVDGMVGCFEDIKLKKDI